MVVKLLTKGAEADLILDDDWNGRKVLIKRRGVKNYRHKEIDRELRKLRTVHEASILHRAKEAGVPTPLIYLIDSVNAEIVMEYVDGVKVRDIVSQLSEEECRSLFKLIGKMAGYLHLAGIIHGDLTTSNMIKIRDRVVFIDFGLGEVSSESEKRGVDVNLMRRMLSSTHYEVQELLQTAFDEGYRDTMGLEAEGVFQRVEEIRRRGRYVDKES
ncbi:MAG: Kae1-associated kinase Bud32 [Candidatus Bathyarchaeota archaeon]|nr:Kae1-associated kinase Bud32 [Candidatus Bathyarchaeota archaeon]